MSSWAVLKIRDLTLSVKIGCTPEERSKKQEVRISFRIQLPQTPKACLSDRLSDTICYETLIGSIQQLASSQAEMNTIEKFGYECFQILKKDLPPDAKLFLSVHKVHPPIDCLQGGVQFELSDEGFRP